MDDIFELDKLKGSYLELQSWLLDNVLDHGVVGQVVVIGLAYWVAVSLASRIEGWVQSKTKVGWLERARFEQFRAAIPALTRPALWLVFMWLVVVISSAAVLPLHLSKGVMSLLTAWIVIRLASTLIKEPGWSRLVAVTAWALAALNIVDLLTPTIELLDSLALNLGDLRISVLSVGKGIFVLGFLLWLASLGSHLLEKRIQTLPNLTPSVQVLFIKLLKITFFTVAIVAALHSVGIDLTAFAVFGGAVGLGVGFGLQKVVSNLISGVILLMDKSVKPGDVIAIGDQFGWINSLGARYVSLITRDGIEHLIPNEELISQRVENWSYSHQLVRLKVPFGIAYDSDVRKAIRLAEKAACEVERVLSEPKPAVRVVGLGDSAIELNLRFWIRDPKNGVTNVKSDVLLCVIDTFRESGVEIPFPHRNVILNADQPVPVRMVDDITSAQVSSPAAEKSPS